VSRKSIGGSHKLMIRRAILAAAFCSAILPAAASAASVTTVAGTRLGTVSQLGPIGQSFVADEGLLNSFGFQFALANSGTADAQVTFQLLEGAGLGGSSIFSRTATVTGPTGRTGVFYDFASLGVALTVGQSYTAVLSAASNRFALVFGPAAGATTDAYAQGSLFATTPSSAAFNGCAAAISTCDANFRFTTSAAAAAVPEPATWATMIGGLVLVGGVARRRRARVSFAA